MLMDDKLSTRSVRIATVDATVRLVGRFGGTTTGLSRYGDALRAALERLGVAPQIVRASMPIPRGLARLGRRLGLDADAFFSTYPVAIPRGASGTVTHLTSQN